MIALLQRVREAAVDVAGERVAGIGHGLLVLVGVQRGDTDVQAERLLERVLGYRVFADAQGRMNRSVREVQGAVLWVPQFTLAADTGKGSRPSFSPAAPPEEGERLFAHLVKCAARESVPCAQGRFGADMAVSLINEGPVTFWLHVPAETA